MTISVQLPDTTTFVKLDQHYLQQAFVAMLYYLGKLSEKEACSVLSMTRRAFEDLLPQFGFSVLSDTQEQIERELQA